MTQNRTVQAPADAIDTQVFRRRCTKVQRNATSRSDSHPVGLAARGVGAPRVKTSNLEMPHQSFGLKEITERCSQVQDLNLPHLRPEGNVGVAIRRAFEFFHVRFRIRDAQYVRVGIDAAVAGLSLARSERHPYAAEWHADRQYATIWNSLSHRSGTG